MVVVQLQKQEEEINEEEVLLTSNKTNKESQSQY